MIEQRIKGLFWTIGTFLVAANAGIFFLLAALDERYGFFGLYIGPRLFIYMLAAPVALYFGRPIIARAFENMQAPGIWASLMASLRLNVLQAGVLLTIYFFLKDVGVSRLFLLSYLGCCLLANWLQVYAGPGFFASLFFRSDEMLKGVVYGHGALPKQLREYIRRTRAMGIDIIGYYADEALDLPGIEWLGNTRQVLSCEGGRKRVRASILFAFTDKVDDPAFKENIDLAMRRGARVQIYSHLTTAFLDPVRIVSDGQVQFITFHDEPLQNPVNVFMKRAADIAISLPVVLFVLPPLVALVWLMQRIQSPGPVFFKQTRYGMNRHEFTILKFRTMHVHDRKMEGKQATKGDSRIYKFGAFLRKSSLDEFPQFFNALRGDMSVVGPRPHLTLHDEQFEKYYRRYRSRHFVKPGITGLAQVSGYRGEATDDEAIIGRVRHDLNYITQWTLSTELYIILKTAWQVIRPPKSAY